ncbi:hypothetical protein DdX_03422 [Ditylenchus destructor]|uniref:Uncharacterized protein n=1 Tax=Ditylenchus destructor TaxID=166010 RepID=A0AAD4NA27_9BILA|nr:hypothetical protein DdX_03422 [Ditylenchus destructor]
MVINAERPAIKYKRDVDEFVQPPSDKIPIGSVENSQRYRYRELAETEFQRPGYYPVPFVVGGVSPGGAIKTIPQQDLTELVRNHIAHRRRLHNQVTQLENVDGTPILQGVRKITELRQTPYRRFPTNTSSLSYEEKRRRWKAELRRRLKQPARPLEGRPLPTSVLISHPAATRTRDEDRYYITYSPYNRVYQVSRRPPPHLYTTDTDEMPRTIDDTTQISTVSVPSTEPDDELIHPRQEEEVIETQFSQPIVKPTDVPPRSVHPGLHTTPPPASNQWERTNIEVRVAAIKPTVKLPIIKQILHLDDYDQDMEDDEAEQPTQSDFVENQRQPPPTEAGPRQTVDIPVRPTELTSQNLPTPQNEDTTKIVYPTASARSTPPTQTPYTRPPYTRPPPSQTTAAPSKQSYTQPEWDDLDEDEEEEEDLFFWKPGGAPAGQQARTAANPEQHDPFQIVSHQENLTRRKLHD